MKTVITLANCYYNNSLMNFFFRSQATETFNELLETNESIEDIIEILNLSKKQ